MRQVLLPQSAPPAFQPDGHHLPCSCAGCPRTCAVSASAGVDFASYSPEHVEEARSAATAALQERQSADQDGAVATSLRSAEGVARSTSDGMCKTPAQSADGRRELDVPVRHRQAVCRFLWF